MSNKFYLYSSSEIYSGAEKMLLILAKALYTLSKDNRVYLTCASEDFVLNKNDFSLEVRKTKCLKKISSNPLNSVIYFIAGFRCFFKRGLIKNDAIFIFNDIESLVNNWPVALLNRSFFYLHDSHKIQNVKARIICWIISLLVDKILVITKSRVDILKSIGVKNTIYFPNCTIYQPVEVKKNIQLNEVHCLCVAQITRWKRIDKVIELFKILADLNADKKWFLHICGRPDKNDPDALMLESEIIQQSHIDPRITYHGYKPDLRPLWQQSQFLISMSENEPFGLALVEALYYGCYIISAQGEGPMEIIDSGEAGVVIDSNMNIRQWSETNIDILLETISSNLKYSDFKRFSFDNFCENLNKIIVDKK
ncbi:glycosyltransferase family 4 protein [Shewanella sp. HN-41]|uniref:glycosyltransferase family 4 protein n=1 Tax=Shewanella sp. HN-41 TaxID=327275 RepID=UPI0002125F40|nr:glycosyltransferase family 4 protein [Shewanella sp. HN-41]EGM69248.1 hypothetical protein SOHN41_02704 [Shewanella sp. HN-41]